MPGNVDTLRPLEFSVAAVGMLHTIPFFRFDLFLFFFFDLYQKKTRGLGYSWVGGSSSMCAVDDRIVPSMAAVSA